MQPLNDKLAASLPGMRAKADAVEAASAGFVNAVDDVCGTACQDVLDSSGVAACAFTWREGCGELPPPQGFTPSSSVAELCASSCAVYLASVSR
eukprot:CAMPEP_0183347078 /NCGR_PEP_ID=MMETSP0164_2-20130417/12016_1 /TAXON_ID=221442 /ORGANISM="Coccolithus pelagicus ssp braarudi, Strain PLY182g" /LENGTH=93 /DNA_ID=CAMNT_0025518459 /DNA_START=33 /DNA_END=314 /DNA_ORIENTATION=+